MQQLELQILDWLSRFGYGAAVPAVLSDPAGIPWAWIFLMLLAKQAGKNVVVMLLIGFSALWAWDIALYFVGEKWGTKLLAWLARVRPAWKQTLDKACDVTQKRGALTVVIGRYLPLVGRWVGLGAGMARVPRGAFVVYSAIGSALSALGFGIAAHLLGRQIVGHPLLMPLALGCCVVGILGGGVAVLWSAWKNRALKNEENPPATREI